MAKVISNQDWLAELITEPTAPFLKLPKCMTDLLKTLTSLDFQAQATSKQVLTIRLQLLTVCEAAAALSFDLGQIEKELMINELQQ